MTEQVIEQQEIPTVNSFKLDIEEFDAISFYREDDGYYSFMILKLSEQPHDYEMTDMGYKFIMMLSEKGKKGCEVTEAILGDPVHMLKNFVKARCEGMIVKKCSRGTDLVERILKKAELNRLANTLGALVKAKEASIV